MRNEEGGRGTSRLREGGQIGTGWEEEEEEEEGG